MGDQRLCARVRGLPPARRQSRRPARPQARLRGRARAVRRRLDRGRLRLERGVADRRPVAAGPRRRGHLARGPVDPDDDLPRGSRAEHRARRLGSRRHVRRCRRRPPRRHLHRPAQLGVDLLHQRPGGAGGARADARPARREPRRSRAGLRRPRCGARHGGSLDVRLRDHEGERLRLDVGEDARALRRGGRASRRLRRGRAAETGPADVVLDLQDQDGDRGERRRLHPRHRALLDVPDADPLHAAGARLLGPEVGLRVPRRRRDLDLLGHACLAARDAESASSRCS